MITLFDDRARALIDPTQEVKCLATGATWAEGPVYLDALDGVLFSDVQNNRTLFYSKSEGLVLGEAMSQYSNGQVLDLEGRLIRCEQGRRLVSRFETGGHLEVLADHYASARFNSPNDVIVKKDGSIWFTDPFYGIASNQEGFEAMDEHKAEGVYCIESGQCRLATQEIVRPNGLAFSPDESLLYISDTEATHAKDGNHAIYVFDVVDNALHNKRLFIETDKGVPDGFALDVAGNVYTSALDGVHIYAPDGTHLAHIAICEKTANLTFGDTDWRGLYICASTSLYYVKTKVQGDIRRACDIRALPIIEGSAL